MLILSVIVMQLPAFGSEAATTTAQLAASDFAVNSDGVLTKYRGTASSVVIPSNVITIATDAFRDNARITSVAISDSVSKIEPYAFWNCSNLSMVSIGSGLDEIGDYVFANCKSLSSANIPSNIKRIGIHAFEDDINLTDITIPVETMDIHKTAFDGCYKLVIHAVEGSYPWKYAQGFYVRQQEFPEYEDIAAYNPDAVIIEDIITGDGSDNGEDGDGTGGEGGENGSGSEDGSNKDGNTYPEPDGETLYTIATTSNPFASSHVVANSAVIFMNGSSPQVHYGSETGNPDGSGNLPGTGEDGNSSSEDGGIDADGTDGEDGTVPEGILPKYTIVDGKAVADQAYYLSNRLKNVVIPDTVTEIGQFSYARSSVESVILPTGLETIGYGAFYHCDNLGPVSIPGTVKRIEPKAFTFTKWLTDFENGQGNGDFLISGDVLVAYRGSSDVINIPEGIRLIASSCFRDHDEITGVIFPESLEIIGEEAFAGCINLYSLNLENTGLKSIHDRAFRYTAVTEVLLPESFESIGINAFDDDCNAGFKSTVTPVITHENTAERLSNSEYRENAYRSSTKEVSTKEEMPGVKVNGDESVIASLEGADRAYSLYVSKVDVSPLLNSAIGRASEFLEGRELDPLAYYDIELTDKSGIAITKLGHAALTVAVPMPEIAGNSKVLTILTIDRNGQLEEIKPEIVNAGGQRFVRFATYHLSPFGLYETGELLYEGDIIVAENVIEAHAAPKTPAEDISHAANFKEWLYTKRFRILPAVALLIGGVVLILYKKKSKKSS